MIQSSERIEPSTPGVTRQIIYTLQSGPVIHAKCLDPYGLWRLNFEKGPLPAVLEGDYTSLSEVEKAINFYDNKKADKFENKTV